MKSIISEVDPRLFQDSGHAFQDSGHAFGRSYCKTL